MIALIIAISILSSGCGSIIKILGIATIALEWDKSQKKKNEPPFPYDNYYEISTSTLMNGLEQNVAKAVSVTKGKKLKIIDGKIGTIDSDGDQFHLEHDAFTISSITCYVENKSIAQKQLLDMKRGQQVDIYGTIVGETFG